MKRGKVVEVIIDSDKLYYALDENDNAVVSKEFVGLGIFVNPTRSTVVEFKKSLTTAEKLKLKQFIEENEIVVSRMPELQSIHFMGDFIEKIRQTINVGQQGIVVISENTTIMLDKFTAVVDDDPSFDHYTFLKPT